MITFMKIFEGLFSLIIVGLLVFFIWAKVVKKKPLQLYNDTMDWIMGMNTPDVNIKNPLSGLRKRIKKTIK